VAQAEQINLCFVLEEELARQPEQQAEGEEASEDHDPGRAAVARDRRVDGLDPGSIDGKRHSRYSV
jgi:hypothetical protein